MKVCRLIGEEWDICTWFECLCCKEKWAKDCPIWNIIQVLRKQDMILRDKS